jgi:aryl-alcohol dehydrogenase-like predicted oxidoreductase
MDDLVHQGKILYWGTSEWTAPDIMHAYGIARELGLTPPQMEQPQYNLVHRERVEMEYLPLFKEIGLGTTIWSPLASGLLSGKYDEGVPAGSRASLEGYEWLRERMLSPGRLKVVSLLKPIAKQLECTLAQLAIAWCLKNPNVSSVITGATKPEQVIENMKAIDVAPKITAEVMEKIDATLGNKPQPPGS